MEISPACRALRKQYQVPDTDIYVNITELATIRTSSGAPPLELHHIHIPKTGGTTISSMLHQHFPHNRSMSLAFMPHGNCTGSSTGDDGHVPPHNKNETSVARFNDKCAENPGCICSIWHTPPRYISPSLFAGRVLWTVVRHPIDRAISQFKMFFANKGYSNASNPDFYFGQNVFPNHLLTDLTPTKHRPHPKRTPFYADCHFLPQYEYIWLPPGRSDAGYYNSGGSSSGDGSAVGVAHDEVARDNAWGRKDGEVDSLDVSAKATTSSRLSHHPPSLPSRRSIQYVLRYEDAPAAATTTTSDGHGEVDIITLVSSFFNATGFKPRYPQGSAKIEVQRHHGTTDFSHVTAASLNPKTLALLKQYYWKDLCLLGYDTSVSGDIEVEDYSNKNDDSDGDSDTSVASVGSVASGTSGTSATATADSNDHVTNSRELPQKKKHEAKANNAKEKGGDRGHNNRRDPKDSGEYRNPNSDCGSVPLLTGPAYPGYPFKTYPPSPGDRRLVQQQYDQYQHQEQQQVSNFTLNVAERTLSTRTLTTTPAEVSSSIKGLRGDKNIDNTFSSGMSGYSGYQLFADSTSIDVGGVLPVLLLIMLMLTLLLAFCRFLLRLSRCVKA